MQDIFSYCYKVVTINLPNFRKTKATNIRGMFYNNSKLKYIDLSNFEVSSSINNIQFTFSQCNSIVFIKLDLLKINSNKNIENFLNSPYPNITLCIRDENTINILNKYKNLINCSDICFNNNIKIDSKENKCINNCNETEFKFEFNNICYEECPNNTFPIEDEYLCFDKKPEGYYLSNNKTYVKCYDTCKSCDEGGNYFFNNCIECKTNYIDSDGSIYNFLYESNLNGFKNCSILCPYYFFEKENKFICTSSSSCPKEYPLLLENQKKCIENNLQKVVKDTLLNNERNKTEKSKKEEIEFYDNVLNIIEETFISGNYNTSNIDNGEDEIIRTEKLIITYTTTENQKNNLNNNMTLIDLGECETSLRNYYNISINESIYMKKIDTYQEGMKTLKVEYDVYAKLYGINLTKLNLTVCEKSKISISIPIIINGNIDKYNISSGYYNDICYTTTSEYGTDITVKDRQKEFIEKDKIICQEDCDFSEYDYDTLAAKCLCKVKECSESFANMNINKGKLIDNFKNIKNIINFNFLKCYNKLFNKEGISNNIGSYIILVIILFHIITIFIFSIKQFPLLKNKIKTIAYKLKLSKKHKYKIKKKKSLHKNYSNKNIKKKQISHMKTLNYNQTKIIKKVRKKNKEMKEFIEEEINGLSYNLALLYDKRNYCKYYFSLIKTQHNLICALFNNNDYNCGIIKINLFFIGFTIEYIVNALFYDDDTMHKIYESKGDFDLDTQLPIAIYSTLISTILNYPLNCLALSNDAIINFKQNSKKIKIMKKKKVKVLNNNFLIKFVIYFIISFLFLLFFWYYLSMFGVIYKNTQIHLLKDTLISFGLSLIIPFIFYLLPGLFRIPSLSSKNKKRECLYNLSKFLQSF